jgi:DNA-binding NtrC family response regulator
MASGTKIRALSRLLDGSGAPFWVIGPSGHLIYLSAGCATWLGIDVESLLDRRSVAGAAVSEDPLDRLAASLAAPVGTSSRGTSSLKIQPPNIEDQKPEPMEVRFIRVGNDALALTFAIGGAFNDRVVDHELEEAVAIRQRLDAWRKRHSVLATIATAGDSMFARRIRRRLKVASSTRTDMGFFGPTGCGSESIATKIHHLSAPGESILTVEGPLMDAELLDATLMPLVHQLTESSDANATALVRGLDEMPNEAQQRLVEIIHTFGGRLRLLALCGRDTKLSGPNSESTNHESIVDEEPTEELCSDLAEILGALSVVIQPLSKRVDDIPLIATALMDARRSAGDGAAERFSRAALDALVVYPWPGNFDELDQTVQHVMRRATGDAVAVEHLPLAIRSYRPGTNPALTKTRDIALDQVVAKFELRLILDAVDAAEGNRSEAARRLGISRARLLRKIDDANRESDGDNG